MTQAETSRAGTEVRPFQISVPEEDLVELRRRVQATRWPEKETVIDASQGVQSATMRELADYWATDYDMRRFEARLNAFPQFLTEIDGLDIHFLHVRSPHADALPLIITHGWPGSVIEMLNVIGPLTDPAAHGGDPAEAFEVIVPSFPGFGFSTPLPDNPDMNFWVADLWHTLMTGVLGGAPKSAGQWPSSSCLACCPNHAVQPGVTVRRPG
jgi:Epoxide hydrolase N terminus